jgi:hypothetical protein
MKIKGLSMPLFVLKLGMPKKEAANRASVMTNIICESLLLVPKLEPITILLEPLRLGQRRIKNVEI